DRHAARGRLKLAAFLGFALFALSTVNAQMPTTQMPTSQNGGRMGQQVPQMGIPPAVGPNATFQERRIRQLNVERQKEMVSDANDLLKLTARLNAEVAKNRAASLTPDQVRMVARIEKLAKSIREKMSNPVQGSVFENNFPPPMGQPVIP
ncbi:MAG: hypothetical protein ACRD25_03870, partial [Terracidiphilus sp.]